MLSGRGIAVIILIFVAGWVVGSGTVAININGDALPAVAAFNGGTSAGSTEVAGGGSDPATVSETATATPSGAGGLDEASVAYLVHQKINERRQQRGLDTLDYDKGLIQIADEYAELMAKTGHYGHTGPNGNTFEDRYRTAGYTCKVGTNDGDGTYYRGAENILKTFYRTDVDIDERGTAYYDTERELAAGIVNAWMNSSSHRENILRRYWESEGLGIAATREDGYITVYAVQDFC